MILNVDNPVYNTIIIFSIIMILIYTVKPEVVYDNNKNEFRQFGTTNGKTLLPIYVVGILLAVILYVIFYYISKKNTEQTKSVNLTNIVQPDIQNIQLQNIQNQLNQLVQQQVQSQLNQLHKNTNSLNLPNILNV